MHEFAYPEDRSNVGGQRASRQSARAFIRLPASVVVGSATAKHVAFVRDISPTGCFFYCDVAPTEGERVDLVLQYTKNRKRTRLRLSGRVVRVVHSTPTASAGVAIEFDSRHDDVPRPHIRST